MIEFVFAAIAGVLFGTLTGLVPGIHSNTVVFTSMPFYFRYQPSLMMYMSFISGVSVSHTFHNFLPSIFFGLAEAETALAALPGPRMARKGKGLEAFAQTISGGAYSVAALLIVFPILFVAVKPLYRFLSSYMFYIMIFFLAFVVFRSESIVSSTTLVLLSGALGILTFNSNINQSYALMPVFSGLFSMPALFKGISNDLSLPEQRNEYLIRNDYEGTVIGFVSGIASGLLPGVGSAISTSFFAPAFENEKQFLTAMGAVNTSDIFISFIALALIGKSRSGASVALSYISGFGMPEVAFLVSVSIFASGVSVLLALNIAGKFVDLIKYFKLSYFLLAAMAFMLAGTVFLTGLVGVLVLITSSAIGYAASVSDQRKACMAVLIVPAMRFYATGLTV